jgi:formylmethanofuran dehydrogenase subunit E
MDLLSDLLHRSAALHRHLCPRQVLGVRIGLLGLRSLDFQERPADKSLLAILETDGCAADGVWAATGCSVGRRTLRIVDYGKVAATFVEAKSGAAIRVAPRAGIREAAWRYAPTARNKWQAQLEGYQTMPDDELLSVLEVALTFSLAELLSKPGCRAICESCGEEVINGRETIEDGIILCQACAGQAYYQLTPLVVSEATSAILVNTLKGTGRVWRETASRAWERLETL